MKLPREFEDFKTYQTLFLRKNSIYSFYLLLKENSVDPTSNSLLHSQVSVPQSLKEFDQILHCRNTREEDRLKKKKSTLDKSM